MSDPTPPSWLAWLSSVPVVGMLWLVIRNLFINAVRSVGVQNHLENQNRSREIETRLGEVEESVAWIKGRIQDRWGDSGKDS